MSPYTYQLIPSQFGDLAVIGQEHETTPVAAIMIPSPRQTVAERLRLEWPQAVPGSEPRLDRLCERLSRYLSGDPNELGLELLDWSACSPFQERVLRVEYQIPRGEVRTYAQVACQAGSPKGARAAGNALARNPFPIVVPCHRAVRADGSLGGYYGGTAMKRALLDMEGVYLDASGRVVKIGKLT